MPVVSLRAYARHRGVSLKAVQKAIQSGRITTTPDGKIDTEKADAQWERNTGPQQRVAQAPVRQPPMAVPRQITETQRSDLPGTGVLDYAKARAVREQFLARLAKIEFEERSGRLISRDEVQVGQFNANRIIRDGLLNIADRVCGAISSEIAAAILAAGLPAEIAKTIDLTKIHSIISTEVRKVLADTTERLNGSAGSV